MNRHSKFGRKSSEEQLLVKKKPETTKKPSPRNPLKELNTSEEAPRRGCFGFLASTSKDPSSLPRSKSLPRTPKSAPPNPRASPSRIVAATSKSKGNGRDSRFRLVPSSDTGKKVRPEKSVKPKTPDLLLQKWSRRKPGNGNQGKKPNPELTFEVGLEGNGDFMSGTQSGSCLASTPDKTLLVAMEAKQELSTTPNSNTTPPIHSSISPEIPCGSSVAQTPVCFATGHVIAGVKDRRKCRPRGILTVGGGNSINDVSRISFDAPPIAEASIHWIESPSGNASGCRSGSSSSMAHVLSYPDEASVNWLVSPSDEGEGSELRSGLVVEKAASRGFWRFSPSTAGSSKLGGNFSCECSISETTPSSGNGIWRTPSSGASTSPFSAIVQKAAAAASGFKPIRPQLERGYRYGSVIENPSAFSKESTSDGNVISTPSSYSGLRKNGMASPFGLDSMAEFLRSMKPSPLPIQENGETDLFPLPGLSFQFDCPTVPLNSVDLTSFRRPSPDKSSAGKELRSKEKDLSLLDLRISWRDGLISRIFEMGELDCCQWLSDDKDAVSCPPEDTVESNFDFKCGSSNRSLVFKKGNDQHRETCFGSFEFPCEGVGVQKCEGKVPPQGLNTCAESISTEGGGLISSGDSDWTLYYKNDLFEV